MAEEDVLTEEDLKVPVEEIDELSGEEDENAVTPTDDKSASTEVDLKTQLTNLEVSNKGLVKSLTAQRNLRQDLQGQLDGIKEALNTVRAGQVVKPAAEESGESVIPIDFDDDGNPFLDPANLTGLQSTKIAQLEAQINTIQNNTVAVNQQTSEKQALEAILSEKEGYSKAYKDVSKAWDFLRNDVFDDYLTAKGLEAPKTADQAIEIALNSKSMRRKFTEKFPSLDIESVMEAHLIATPRYLRKALDKAITEVESIHETLDLTKPSTLANANSTGGEGNESLISRIADMSTEDFNNLDEKTMAKIDKLLEAHG